jgi:methyltransferase (TIGR00027 family)
MSPDSATPQPDNVGTPAGAEAQSVLKARRPRRSTSAQAALRWRAIESLRPAEERICYDPVAGKLMGPFWRRTGEIGFIRKRLIGQLDREDTGMANWIVARTRYVDDLVKGQIEGGIKQLVILGAGGDTRAYRFHELGEQVKVFELDDLTTLKFKSARLRIVLKSPPPNVVFVPIDLINQKLEDKLHSRIYDRTLKTLFVLEGVTMYLATEIVNRTLAFISHNSGDGSSVVFDCLFESVIDGTADSMEAKRLRQISAQGGKPLLFGIRQDGIKDFLSSKGFDPVQNLVGRSLKDAYFKGKGQQRKVFPLIEIVSARVRH